MKRPFISLWENHPVRKSKGETLSSWAETESYQQKKFSEGVEVGER